MHSIHAHSDFLELFAENGFFAPLFYLLLLLTILIILYSRSKNNQLYFYIFISVLATGIFSLVAFPFYKFSSHFLLSVGTGIALHSKNVNSSKAINVSLKKLMWFLGILLLITSITSILKMKSEFDFIRSVQYLRVKDYSMMNQELEKISNVLFPFDASKQPVDYYRGIANYYLGNNDVAMKSNLDAEKVAPYNPIVLQNIAGSYQSLGNYKKSVEMFERVKKLFPHYINPQINLIHAYLQIGEFEKSRKLFESIKKKEPNHPRLQEFRDKFHPE
ncbi:MAG: tetratricopeptide repeat protein [Ignavibacteriaceae bacterium]|nr:tetratricopeptide repeat protein [Ignavibacteriaceae bacterium]